MLYAYHTIDVSVKMSQIATVERHQVKQSQGMEGLMTLLSYVLVYTYGSHQAEVSVSLYCKYMNTIYPTPP